jgi:glycerol uptake facilitator-like aquaporin
MLNRLLAECLGTAVLLCSVVGSGIMAERLASGNIAVALLANTLVTVFALYVLIEIFAPISGAHFNPAVSLVMRIKGKLTSSEMLGYFVVQLFGAALGVWLAHLMFDMPIFELSSKVRTGIGQWIAEIVATTGLLLVILRSPPGKVSAVVACYIGAAYWFTPSTSFANPAAVFGRMMSDSFSGILPSNALAFVAAELIGALLALLLNRLLGRTAD